MTKPCLKPSMNVGASICIVLSVVALKNRGKITGVVRPLVQPHHYSKLNIAGGVNCHAGWKVELGPGRRSTVTTGIHRRQPGQSHSNGQPGGHDHHD
jgi:hypothetical protein